VKRNLSLRNTGGEFSLTGTYLGEWEGDKRSGRGVQIFRSGEKYDGEWADGKRTGVGIMYRCIVPGVFEKTYEGGWLEGRWEGSGVVEDAVGRYEGEFSGGVRHGRGVQRYAADGSKYDGEWARGVRQGAGRLTMANGDVYSGAWAGGLKEGPGQLVFAARRQVYTGEWREGNPVAGELQGLTQMDLVAGDPAALLASATPAARADGLPLPRLALATPSLVLQRATRAIRLARAAQAAAADGDTTTLPDDLGTLEGNTELGEEEIGQLREAFAVVDPTGQGMFVIDAFSVRALLAALGIAGDEEDVALLMRQMVAAQLEADAALWAGRGGATTAARELAAEQLRPSDSPSRCTEVSFEAFASVLAGLRA
jgi:hypothetical protein